MKLNEKLKELRNKNELTQDQVASSLHVSRQTVSKWELGINEPDLNTLKQLSSLYNVTLEELVNDENKTNVSKLEKANFILYLIFLGLAITSIGSTFIFLRFLKDTLPMHYDSSFNVDRYGSKYETLLNLLFQFPVAIIGAVSLIQKRTKSKAKEKDIMVLNITGIILELASIIFIIYSEAPYLVKNSFVPIILAYSGVITLIASLICHPKILKKPNSLMGVRTPYAFSSLEAWKKINSMGSIILFVSSLIVIILSLLLNRDLALISISPLVIGPIIILIIDSSLYKKEVLNK